MEAFGQVRSHDIGFGMVQFFLVGVPTMGADNGGSSCQFRCYGGTHTWYGIVFLRGVYQLWLDRQGKLFLRGSRKLLVS
jgi:hypothetical protein